MKARIKFAVSATALLVLIAVMFGLSIKRASQERVVELNALPFEEEVEILSADVVRPLYGDQQTIVVSAANWVDTADHAFTDGDFSDVIDEFDYTALSLQDVRDVALVGNRALLATAGGIVEFFTADSSFAIYSLPQGMDDFNCYSVLADANEIYVGTNSGVYLIDSDGIAGRIWQEIDDRVTVLKGFDGDYLVGTESCGLYRVTDDQVVNILPSKSIVDVTEGALGMFVSTVEEGLLFYDGEGWRRRYLRGDTTSFAEVSCLQTAFGRLWAGTPKGVYIFDGGRWDIVNAEDGLWAENVTAIARGKNFIYFGTADSGIFSYFNGSLSPLDFSEGIKVNSLSVSHRRYLLGSKGEYGGALLKTPKRQLEIESLINCAAELASII